MEQLERILEEWLDENVYQIILSNPRDTEQGSKIKIRPILLKGEIVYQQTIYLGTQVFHSNHERQEMAELIIKRLTDNYRQGEIQSVLGTVTVLVSKKGKVTLRVKRQQNQASQSRALEHNRTKKYILEEGKPVQFLIDLGVQTKEGKIVRSRYDKFRQINRYLEFIEDVLPKFRQGQTLRIIDFGCGKSYLTFAMYHYLHVLKGYPVRITGLDLKTDVIRHCNELAEKYGYKELFFERGDISTYESEGQVDMVVSLHACDTATDYALEKAVRWGAEVIFAVPCCQHEVNRQIACPELAPILKYGLIKERIAALVTDAVRANLLEKEGYDTQILEFIDMEHTPKNILIRAVRRRGMQVALKESKTLDDMCEHLHLSVTLQRLLAELKQEKI
ncbi:MAG: SAM-dependent methyltransferase [Lachnospiraceae bacterium]|nr:SAM-dependent methyltransferase [Lachnospiraceae bacterium]